MSPKTHHKPAEFLSTSPSRVATPFTSALIVSNIKFLSTPPSRVATVTNQNAFIAICVSIHATLAGGDVCLMCRLMGTSQFLSTPPSRVATHRTRQNRPETGSFYPRHPRGWRQSEAVSAHSDIKFLSTPPSRVATKKVQDVATHAKFLSTPPSRVATLLRRLRLT